MCWLRVFNRPKPQHDKDILEESAKFAVFVHVYFFFLTAKPLKCQSIETSPSQEPNVMSANWLLWGFISFDLLFNWTPYSAPQLLPSEEKGFLKEWELVLYKGGLRVHLYSQKIHGKDELWWWKVSGCNPVSWVTVCHAKWGGRKGGRGALSSSGPGLIALPQTLPVWYMPLQLREARDNTQPALLTRTMDSLERDLYLLFWALLCVWSLWGYFWREMCLFVSCRSSAARPGFDVEVRDAGGETLWGRKIEGRRIRCFMTYLWSENSSEKSLSLHL